MQKPHVLGNALGYADLGQIHSDWIRFIWGTNENRTLQAHRGSYKTTAVTVVGTIYYLLFNPNARILICRKEAGGSAAILDEISKHLKGRMIRALVKQFYNRDLYLLVDKASPLPAITWSLRNEIKKEPSIMGVGIKSPITSYHFDRILTDDIVTLKDRVSAAERKTTDNFYIELKNIVDPGCPISNCGTPWHKNDTFRLMPKPDKFPIGKTGLKSFTKEHIKSLRAEIPPAIFSINYLLQHTADENLLFQNPVYGELPKNWRPYGHIDKAYGGGDSTVFTLIGADHNGQLYGLGRLWKKNVMELYSVIFDIWKFYKGGRTWTETNDDKKAASNEFKTLGMPIKTYHESMNKHVKIQNYLFKYWHKIIWSTESDPEYMAQITEYEEKAEHDDAPDSVASLLREANFEKSTLESFYS